MAAFGYIVWRLLVMAVGLVLAGGVALAIVFFAGPVTSGLEENARTISDHSTGNIVTDIIVVFMGVIFLALLDLLLGTIFILILAGPVLVIAALISEAFRLRSWVYYALVGLAGGVLPAMTIGVNSESDLAVPVIFASCALGSLTYWLVAGRTAGFFRREPGHPPLPAPPSSSGNQA